MSWFSKTVGSVGKFVAKKALPAVAEYGGAVVGGAVGTVVGGPAGAVAGAAAGKAATDAIKGAGRSATRGKRKSRGRRRAPPRSRRRARIKVRRRGGRRIKRRGTFLGRLKKPMRIRVRKKKSRRGKRRRRPVSRSFLKRMRSRLKKRIPSMSVPAGSQKGDALVTAGRLIASMQSADPRLRAYAKAVMNATARRARKGDPSARRAVSFLTAAQSANQSKGRLTGFLVTNSGRVVIGSFIQTG